MRVTAPRAMAAAIAASFALGISPAGAANNPQVVHGTFRETQAGADLGYSIAGSAKLTVSGDSTSVTVQVEGLDPTKEYASHVHNGSCSTGGGAHYKNDEAGGATPTNEIWLSSTDDPAGHLMPNPGGVAHGSASETWAARLDSTTRTNARSVVVHEPGSGARIACADLT